MSTRRFKPYPAYKDSGVEWLGEIPVHWTAKRVRQACSRVTDGAHISPDTSSADFPFVSTADIRGGVIDFDGCLRTSDASYGYMERTGCRPKNGDVLFSKDGTVGTTAVVTTDRAFAVASSLVILSPVKNEVDARWLNHWLNGVFIKEQVELLLSGAALRRISVAKVGRLPVLLPPTLDEQRVIAGFLDRETARIDALVAKKERLIELLQEQRTALITRAVTKGLDPNVPMKDSGIEWLGEIPAHWEVRRLKHLAHIASGFAPPGSLNRSVGEYPVYGSNGLIGYCDQFLLSEETLAVGRVGASGLVNVVPANSWVTDNALLLRDLPPGAFLAWLRYVLETMNLGAQAAKNAQPIITGTFLGNQELAAPRASEQRAIAAFLDRETLRIDALGAKVRDAIDHLKELRTALISAAVTGKIDVREEVA